jgi:hypothetical protein
MNPYYAHESAVGPVFDVAHHSRFKALVMGLIALGFAGLISWGAAYFWNPDWVVSEPSQGFAEAHQEAKDFAQQHPWGVITGVGIAALFALLCVAGAASCVVEAVSGDYYIRAGEGGLSMRVPGRLFGVLQRDFHWSEIADLTVIQRKRMGSMSRSAGNLGGELQLRTHDGFSRDVRLDHFREDAWLIYQRIEEAMEMRPAVLA